MSTYEPSLEWVREVMEEVDQLDLPDGAYWCLVHERLGMDYGEVFAIIADHPEFFGATEVASPAPR